MTNYDPAVYAKNEQIRSGQYLIHSDSLLEAGAEPQPDQIIRDLLSMEWTKTSQTPRPEIFTADEKVEHDYARTPGISVQVTDYQEQPVGNRVEFVEVNIPIELEIMTANRQWMWNMMAEVRRIVYKWMLALRPYQMIYFEGWRPDVNGPKDYTGTVRLRLNSKAIPVFTRELAHSETPNIYPEDFIQNESLGISQ